MIWIGVAALTEWFCFVLLYHVLYRLSHWHSRFTDCHFLVGPWYSCSCICGVVSFRRQRFLWWEFWHYRSEPFLSYTKVLGTYENDDIYNWRMSFLSGIVCISASVSGCHTPSSTSLIMFWNADYHRGCSVHLYFQRTVLNTCSWIVPKCSSTWVSSALSQCRNAMWHNLRKKYLYSVGTEPPRYFIALIATSILITCILINYTTHEPCEDVADGRGYGCRSVY